MLEQYRVELEFCRVLQEHAASKLEQLSAAIKQARTNLKELKARLRLLDYELDA